MDKVINLYIVTTAENKTFLVNADNGLKGMEIVEKRRGLEPLGWSIVIVEPNDCVDIENAFM